MNTMIQTYTEGPMWLQEIRRYWTDLMHQPQTASVPSVQLSKRQVKKSAVTAGNDPAAANYQYRGEIACANRGQRPGAGGGRQVATMDPRIRQFVSEHARNLVGLDVALFFQANPKTFDTAEGLGRRIHRDVEQVREALDRLADCGVLDVFSRGEGRYKCYALARDRAIWSLLCMLSEAYMDDLEARKDIVRLLIRTRTDDKRSRQDSDSSP